MFLPNLSRVTLRKKEIITILSNKLLRDINYCSKLLAVNIGKLTTAEPYTGRTAKSLANFMVKERKVA